MIDLDKVDYSTKPVTLAQHIWMQRAQRQDFEGMLSLILARTNIPEEEALEFDDEELGIVITKVCDGIIASTVLNSLGKGFFDA